tara:strand:- start:79 stop:360 length:282 start_codon:yes stop_codon:yes gene_type:complete
MLNTNGGMGLCMEGKLPMTKKPFAEQVGGDHYKKLTIQPVEYILANNLGFVEGAVIKYVTRWKDKNGIEDLHKARHFIDLLIQFLEETDHAQR